MNRQLRWVRLYRIVAALLLAAVPATVSAHENIGDDELAVANWMLISAFVAALVGVFLILWAVRSGQFNNVEESKYNMLNTAEDYDAIMAESDAREAALRAEGEQTDGGTKAAPGTKAANATSGPAGGTATRPNGI